MGIRGTAPPVFRKTGVLTIFGIIWTDNIEASSRSLIVLSLAMICVACPENSDDIGRPPVFALFQFTMLADATGAQNFIARTNDPQVIADAHAQLELPIAQRTLFIIGPVAGGDGGDNTGWDRHFVPNEWNLTEAAIELCDGNPVLVNQAVDYWIGIGLFCPWGARVIAQGGFAP